MGREGVTAPEPPPHTHRRPSPGGLFPWKFVQKREKPLKAESPVRCTEVVWAVSVCRRGQPPALPEDLVAQGQASGPVSGRASRAAGAFSQPRPPPRCLRTRPACPAHAPPIRPARPSRGPASSAPLRLFGVSPPSVFCVGSRTDVRGTPTAPEAQRRGPRAVGRKFSPRRPLLTWHSGVRRGAGAAACSA